MVFCSGLYANKDCENYFTYQTNDNLTFEFQGFVIPDVQSSYFWDFGDGTTGSGQTTIKSFVPQGVAYYTVCLTTISYDTISGDTCEAISCQDVYIGNSLDCEAYFYTQTVPGSITTIVFTNASTGAYTNLIWDFGDGTTSTDENPVHDFNTTGIYNVCLSIWDSLEICQDTFCDSIQVGLEGYYTLYISGNVVDDVYFLPVEDQEMDISIDSNNLYGGYFNTILTDDDGFYHNEVTIPVEMFEGFAEIGTYECNQQYQSQIQEWIYNYPFITADFVICTDTLIPNCYANFTYEKDTANPYVVKFYDNSFGQINSWFWDFGDGSFSNEINPVHEYNSLGAFNVCLTVSSDTLGSFCTDTYCDSIFIGSNLIAGFIYNLDSASNIPNSYFFHDISIGEPGNWFWDFGDGNSSTDQHPDHQFENSGEYWICLEISKEVSPGIFDSDIYCQFIVTPNYFNLGGAAFIGNVPINNPVSTGDTGIAFLYKKYPDIIVPIDTNLFYDLGYYWFTDVREGDYIVKVGLTDNSSNYSNYSTTYHEDAVYWDQTAPIVMDTNNYYTNVFLNEVNGIDPGPGSIDGFVTLAGDIPALLNSNSEIDIRIYNNSGVLLSNIKTDEEGSFTIDNIALGTYNLYAEVTGLYSEVQSIFLDEDNSSISNVDLEVFNEPLGKYEFSTPMISIGELYPNPVKNLLNLDVELKNTSLLKFAIYNLIGAKVYESTLRLANCQYKVSIDVQFLPAGSYLLLVFIEEGKIFKTQKFIK